MCKYRPNRFGDNSFAGTSPAYHSGTFDWPERTVIIAPSPGGDDLAEAVRRAQTVLLSAGSPEVFYGSDRLTARAWAALAEGPALREGAAARLKAALDSADLTGLLKARRESIPRDE